MSASARSWTGRSRTSRSRTGRSRASGRRRGSTHLTSKRAATGALRRLPSSSPSPSLRTAGGTHGRRDARQAGGAGRDGRQLGSGPLGDRVPALLEPPWAARRQAGDLRRPRGKAAASRGLGATAQRGRVHVLRNAMQHAGRTQRRIVSAWIGTAFAEADQLRPRVSKLAELMDGAADDVLACMGARPPSGLRSAARPRWSASTACPRT